RDLVKYCNENTITKMAIIVRPVGKSRENTRCESRKIVNINDMMSYIDFKYPGDNHVVAFPVLTKTCAEKVLIKASSGWDNFILKEETRISVYCNYDTNQYLINKEETDADSKTYSQLCFYAGVNTIDVYAKHAGQKQNYKTGKVLFAYEKVNMPDNCFASEPSEAEKSWVNFFFRDPAWDECDYRRRRI